MLFDIIYFYQTGSWLEIGLKKYIFGIFPFKFPVVHNRSYVHNILKGEMLCDIAIKNYLVFLFLKCTLRYICSGHDTKHTKYKLYD